MPHRPNDRDCGLGQTPEKGLGGTGILNDTLFGGGRVMCVSHPRISFRIIVYSKSGRLLLEEPGSVACQISHWRPLFSFHLVYHLKYFMSTFY